MAEKYYGKYKGMVMNNIDPQQMGRLLVQVPGVSGLGPGSWAMPCVPLAGKQMGVFVLPVIGSGVWVEFEAGDIDSPIWSGCYWASVAEVPALALAGLPVSPSIVLQTQAQNTIMISDVPGPTGGFLIRTTTGASISINDTGIIIQNGKGAIISMTGPVTDINMGALTIT
jgi:uncharacterized protein involved in type VI secretion and phage assembly